MDPALATLRAACSAWTPQEWAMRPATDYYVKFSAEGPSVTSGDAHELADYGWTTTSLTLANGSGADLPDAGWSTLDWGTPGNAQGDGANDLIQSPAIFADPMGFWEAAVLLGSTRPPRTFVADFWAIMGTSSADESTSGFGLVEAGGAAGTANDRFAWIRSDSASFLLGSGAATGTIVANLTAVATLILHRIVIDRIDQLITWYTSLDGVTFTKRATLAVETDLLPCSFGAFAGTTNRVQLCGTGHFYYI